jgi:DNA-binding NarL/FixJ family response regulator
MRGSAFYRIGELQRLQGELAQAQESFREASQHGRNPQPGLSMLRLAEGEVQAAAASIRGVLAETREERVRAQLLISGVEILLASQDREGARASAAELSIVATLFEAPFLRAATAHHTGAVLLDEGDARGALTLLRDALRDWQELETPYEEAETRALIARALEHLGDEGGRDVELDAAHHLFRRLGAPVRLDAVGAATDGHEEEPGDLSDRELQVLRLIAAGKTNRAIGDELFISEKTVARHVSNIFNKLGVSSRAGATASAYQRHLV